jgi:hypothetical protein
VQRDPRAHGTPARYGYGRCRCGPCRSAASAAARDRYRLKAYGQWQPWADAAPVREHVRALQAEGIGWPRVASLAGASRSTVSTLLYGRGGKPPSTRIRTATAEALLAVRPGLEDLPGTACVDATGTRRRLQGLGAAGWSAQRLADCLGKDRSDLARIQRGDTPRVTVATALAVRGLCRDLRALPPAARSPWDKTAVTRARSAAAARGWPPLAAWDEIDDPAAKPAPGWDRGKVKAGERADAA